MVAITVPVLAGCSAGTAGLVSGEVVEGDGARVIVVNSYGLSVRAVSIDGGLTVGFSRRAYVYPKKTPGLPATGRYSWWVPQPGTPPVAWSTTAVGLDLKASRLGAGVSLGYQADTVMAYLPADADLFYSLHFSADDPAMTMMLFCNGEQSCAEIID